MLEIFLIIDFPLVDSFFNIASQKFNRFKPGERSRRGILPPLLIHDIGNPELKSEFKQGLNLETGVGPVILTNVGVACSLYVLFYRMPIIVNVFKTKIKTTLSKPTDEWII